MRVILANPRGFCAGVQMAIDVVDQVLDLYPNRRIYVFHEIVHNRHVVGRFKDRGVIFVDDLSDVPEGEIVVFSAHGVSPSVRALATQRRLTAVDATCPLVTKVHSEAVRYARQGYRILLVGHAEHQEVIGTQGEAPDSITVVESPEDVRELAAAHANAGSLPGRVAYLTQTTLSTDDAEQIIGAIRSEFPAVREPPSSDICYATTNRQAAVRQIAPECDLVLVVGSRNSSNSVRLTEIAANVGVPAHLIDDATEIRDEWLVRRPSRAGDSQTVVLVTAGASAPEDLVAEVCRTLIKRHGGVLEQRDIFREEIEFGLPATLKRMMREQGQDPDSRTIRVGAYEFSEARYGAVPLTVHGRLRNEA